MKAMMIGAAALAGVMGLAAASPAAAQANVMKDCAAKYQAAKAANKLPAGQTWIQYLAQCRGSMKAAPVAAAAPAPAPVAASASKTTAVHTVTAQKTVKTNVPAGQRTPGQIASAERQKQCGAQWKVDHAAGKTGTMTWPQYWSACSKRLKG